MDKDDKDLSEQPQYERRRQADRRTDARHGKFDRRQNRCGRCRHFRDNFCQHLNVPMRPEDFSCPVFEVSPYLG